MVNENKSHDEIANLFDVSPIIVDNWLNLYCISDDVSFNDLSPDVCTDYINAVLKNTIKDNQKEYLSNISKMVAMFTFRQGVVEKYHNVITDKMMCDINKCMVNRLAYIFDIFLNDRWIELEVLLQSSFFKPIGWDNPIIEDLGNINISRKYLEKIFTYFCITPKK